MNLESFSHTEYKRYCKAEGSQHIASEFALLHILKLIKKYNFQNILEVGVGIGTISGSILKYAKLTDKNISCTCTEANKFCLSQLPLNLGNYYSDLKVYKNVNELPSNSRFDLIIIDGAEEHLKSIQEKVMTNALILVEGDRKSQVKEVITFFPKSKFVQFLSIKRNEEYSASRTGDFRGGLKVIFTNPSVSQLLFWLQMKIETKVKYLIRRVL